MKKIMFFTWIMMIVSLFGTGKYVDAKSNQNVQFNVNDNFNLLNKTAQQTSKASSNVADQEGIVEITTDYSSEQRNTTELNPPRNLTAHVSGSNVDLNWNTPAGNNNEGTWFTHAQADEYLDSIGTGGTIEFMVAQRFSSAQLENFGVAGAQLTQVAFMPAYASAQFTLKVWTGGSASPYNPGTLVLEQAVGTAPAEQWMIVDLTNPINIPSNQEIWIGYLVSTNGGYPAGCDEGPVVNGFGNLMYFGEEWTTLSSLNAQFTYNWMIKGLAETPNGALVFSSKDAELNPEVIESVITNNTDSNIVWSLSGSGTSKRKPEKSNRTLLGYKVYRGETLLNATLITSLSYTDSNVLDGQYTYLVTAVYDEGESLPVSVNVNVNSAAIVNFPWFEGFEGISFPPANWTILDNDGDGFFWEQYIETGAAHTGSKCAASASFINNIGVLTPDNWLITPAIQLPSTDANDYMYLRYFVAAQDPSWPQEHYAVMISNTDTQLSSFTNIFNETLSSGNWIERTVNLSAYEGQTIYIAFRHYNVTDMFYIKLDDVWVGNTTSESDLTVSLTGNRLNANYPNPFNPETSINFTVANEGLVSIEIFNSKGQRVKTLVNENYPKGNYKVAWQGQDDSGRNVGSGLYFYRMKSGSYTATRKMILMK